MEQVSPTTLVYLILLVAYAIVGAAWLLHKMCCTCKPQQTTAPADFIEITVAKPKENTNASE